MIYILKNAGGHEIARSSVPIVADGSAWATPSQRWLDPVPGDGSFVEQAADPVPVPAQVTRRQAKQALRLSALCGLPANLLANVQPAIDAIPDAVQRDLVQIEWADSQVFERQRPALLGLATALGLSSAQLDTLFIFAESL